MAYKNPPKETQFKKGDAKINRLGRPKSFKTLRKMMQAIAAEVATGSGDQPIIIKGEIQTNATMMARQIMKDKPVEYLHFAYGKPKDEVEHSGEITAAVTLVEVVRPKDE